MDSIDNLGDMSKDELLALCVQLYEDARKKIAAGEGTPELEAAAEYARRSIEEAVETAKGDASVH